MISQNDKITLLNQVDLEYQIQNERIGLNARRNNINTVKKPLNAEQNEMITDYYKIYGEPVETPEGEKKLYNRPEAELILHPIEDKILSDKEIEQHFLSTIEEINKFEEAEFRKQIAEFTTTFNAYSKREIQSIADRIKFLEEEYDNNKKRLEEELKDSGLTFKRNKINFELSPIKEELKEKKNELKTLEEELNLYYESTVDEIKQFIQNKAKGYKIMADQDFIYISEKNEANKQLDKENKLMIDDYRQKLKDLNLSLNVDEKQPYETNDEYFQRIQDVALQDYPEYMLKDASSQINKVFRKRLSEIIKKPVDINTVFNSIEPLGQAEKKNVLLKQWTIIKDQFNKTFGEDNKFVTPEDILEFFKLFYSTNEKGETKIVFDKSQSDKIKGSMSVQKGKLSVYPDKVKHQVKIVNNETKKDVYIRILKKANDGRILLFSFTGLIDSFNEWTSKSLSIVKNATNIQAYDLEILYNNNALNNYQIPFHLTNFINYIENTLGITPFNEFQFIGGEPVRNEEINYTPATYTKKGTLKTDEIYGMGNEELEKTAKLGDVHILLKKLYYENILSVLNKHMNQYQGFKVSKISEKLVHIIMNLLKGVHPTSSELYTLSDKEKQIYDRLISVANLHKKIVNNKENTVEKLKKRMKLIESEIEIGNNNPELTNELENILLTLKDLKVITLKQVKDYIKQFK